MKKVLSILLAIALLFSMAACGKEECAHEFESSLSGETVTFSCKKCGQSYSVQVDIPEKIVEVEKEVPVEVEKEVIKTVVKEVEKKVEVPTYLSPEEKMMADDYALLNYYIDNYAKLDLLKGYVEDNYYIDVNSDELMEGAYEGLVDALGDPYSHYTRASKAEEFGDALSQSYSGIGVVITRGDDNNVYIDSITVNGPAEAAGLKAGDMIAAVDGKSFLGADIDEVATAIRGEVGTTVKVTVLRNSQTIDFNVTRKKVGMPTVDYTVLSGGEGYISISGFDSITCDEMKIALASLENQGVKKFVLDLRDNGGGEVDAALNVADLLMGAETMVYTKDREGNIQNYNTNAGRTSMKYVVLCNENTASAAEMLCAGIQDNGEAKIIGTKTFGKGIVQVLAYITDGSSIDLTMMQYFSPKGNVIHKVGITPDYVVELTDDCFDSEGYLVNDLQLTKALEVLK